MYTYSFGQQGQIVRSDGATIPNDPANTDFQAYVAWLDAGNTPTPWTPPPVTWADFQNQAKAALVLSDITVHRIAEGVSLGTCAWTNADVVAYMTYRRDLRAIVTAETGTPGTLPTAPGYPAGT
jgi:hypothetical protein